MPLIPGASLYYMMVRFVEGDLPDAFMYGETALVIAIAISLGLSGVAGGAAWRPSRSTAPSSR